MTKSRVPSIGSTIQTRGLPRRSPVSGISSDRTTSSGNASRRRATISALAAWSASVTGSSPALTCTFSLLAVVAAHQHGRLARDAGGDLQLARVVVAHAATAAALQVAAQRARPASSTSPATHHQQPRHQHGRGQPDVVLRDADQQRRRRVAQHVDRHRVDREAAAAHLGRQHVRHRRASAGRY